MLSIFSAGLQEPLIAAQEPTRRIRVAKPKSSENIDIKPSKEKDDKREPADRAGGSEQPPDAAEQLAQQKRQSARSIIEAPRRLIKSAQVEYSILVQVEAATLLWEVDREAAHPVLLNAWERLVSLLKEIRVRIRAIRERSLPD